MVIFQYAFVCNLGAFYRVYYTFNSSYCSVCYYEYYNREEGKVNGGLLK